MSVCLFYCRLVVLVLYMTTPVPSQEMRSDRGRETHTGSTEKIWISALGNKQKKATGTKEGKQQTTKKEKHKQNRHLRSHHTAIHKRNHRTYTKSNERNITSNSDRYLCTLRTRYNRTITVMSPTKFNATHAIKHTLGKQTDVSAHGKKNTKKNVKKKQK